MTPLPLNGLKVGDRIPGGRVSHHWATVEKIETDGVTVCYSGTVKSVKLAPEHFNQIGILV